MVPRYTCSVFLVLGGTSNVHGARPLKLIHRAGFDVVDQFEVTAGQVSEVVSAFEKAPLSVAGQGVFTAIVTVDVCPWPPDAASREHDNGRTFRVEVINQTLATLISDDAQCSPAENEWVWVTRNTADAWEVLRRWRPGNVQAYEDEFARRLARIQPPFEVVQTFDGYKNNARVDLVRANGSVAVCKTFREGRACFLENEVAGLRLSRVTSAVPSILDRGDNWVLMPFYRRYRSIEAIMHERRFRTLLSPSLARRVFEAARAIHEAGYAHLDLHPGHVLVGEDGDIKIFDFDRLHRFKTIPPFYESPMIAGSASWVDYNGPNGGIPSYRTVWKHLTGLELEALLEGLPVEHHARQAREELRRLPGRIRSYLRV